MIVLASGGYDSSVLCHEYRDKIVVLVFVDYGQINGELASFYKLAKRLKLQYYIIRAMFYTRPNFLMGHTVTNCIVDNRNFHMILNAAAVSEEEDCNEITLGTVQEDCLMYKDQSEKAFKHLEIAIGKTIFTPYIKTKKIDLYKRIDKSDVRWILDNCTSTYDPMCYNVADDKFEEVKKHALKTINSL